MHVFAKVVEHGSFARAAQILEISNAVVTQHVADLENHLGTRLLNRTMRKLSLTETDHAYLIRVIQILQEIEDVEAIASSQSEKPTGTLRIYSHLGFGQLQLAQVLPTYAWKYPDLALDVMLSDRTVDLVEDEFDANMIGRQLGVSEIPLCASPEYLKRHGTPQTLEDISKDACLNFSHEHLRHH